MDIGVFLADPQDKNLITSLFFSFAPCNYLSAACTQQKVSVEDLLEKARGTRSLLCVKSCVEEKGSHFSLFLSLHLFLPFLLQAGIASAPPSERNPAQKAPLLPPKNRLVSQSSF